MPKMNVSFDTLTGYCSFADLQSIPRVGDYIDGAWLWGLIMAEYADPENGDKEIFCEREYPVVRVCWDEDGARIYLGLGESFKRYVRVECKKRIVQIGG